jgi:hypothetical protein
MAPRALQRLRHEADHSWSGTPNGAGAIARLATVGVAAAALILGGFGLEHTASAHVEIDVGDGQYVMEMGFRDEPAYLGQPNALFLSVERRVVRNRWMTWRERLRPRSARTGKRNP